MEVFTRGVFRTTAQELADMKSLAIWQQMTTKAAIIFRELQSVDEFRLIPEHYRGWTIPALLMTGGESPPQCRATAEMLNTVLPGSRIAVLAGQQHSAMRTAPDLFAQTIIGFLCANSV